MHRLVLLASSRVVLFVLVSIAVLSLAVGVLSARAGVDLDDRIVRPAADDMAIVAVLPYLARSWPEERRDYHHAIDASRFGTSMPGAKESLPERLFR